MSDETEPKPWDDGAVYYSTSADDERLVHEDLNDCIEAHLEGLGGTIEEAVTRVLTVHAWRRDAFDVEEEAKDQLDCFVERMSEAILEEYGDPDGSSENVFGTEAEKAFKAAVTPAVIVLLSTVKPWQCSVVGKRTFTPDELLEWVREHNPEWLEGKS
jgi:hypothetical protein